MSRDPNRINEILYMLSDLWHENPDLRLGQLLVNLVKPHNPCPEVFFIEDDELIEKVGKVADEGWEAYYDN